MTETMPHDGVSPSGSTYTGTGTVPGRNNAPSVWPRNMFFVLESDYAKHFR